MSETDAVCGVSTTFSIVWSGLSGSVGSSSITSRPAPAIFPSWRARIRSASLWVGPRPVLMK